MPLETTLVLVKPDGVERGLVGRIVARLEDRGLTLVAMKLLKPSRELLHKHYESLASKPFFPGLVTFMSSGPVVAMAVRGPRAVAVVRAMMGPTKAYEAASGTIRGDFGLSHSFNLIHGSDAPDTAAREVGLWFTPGEIQDWTPTRFQHVIDRREEG